MPARLGRAVTEDDVREVHQRCPDCLGTLKLTFRRGGVPEVRLCGRAKADFNQRYAGRIEQGPMGPHWKAGASPEEGAFTDLFFLDMIERAWRHDFHVDALRWAARQQARA